MKNAAQEEILAPFAGLSIQDAARARLLAKAFRGRWVPGVSAYAFTKANHARWKLTLEAGVSCVYRRGAWWFRQPGSDAPMDRTRAVRLAKEAVCHA
jgi:hypothetical protein